MRYGYFISSLLHLSKAFILVLGVALFYLLIAYIEHVVAITKFFFGTSTAELLLKAFVATVLLFVVSMVLTSRKEVKRV